MTRLVKIPKLRVIADIKENRKHLVTLAPNAKSRIAGAINEHIVSYEGAAEQYQVILPFEDVLAWPDDYQDFSKKEKDVLISKVTDIAISLTRFSQFKFVDCCTNPNRYIVSLYVYDSWLTKVQVNVSKMATRFLQHSKTQDFLALVAIVCFLGVLALAFFNLMFIAASLLEGNTVHWFNWLGLAAVGSSIFFTWLTND